MIKFIVRRLLLTLPTFVALMAVTFIAIRLVPGDPVEVRTGERGISPDTIRLLQGKGHRISVGPSMGSTQTIHRADGILMGAADTRQRGTGERFHCFGTRGGSRRSRWRDGGWPCRPAPSWWNPR